MKYTLKFGKTTFAVTVPASVSPEEISRFASEALEHAADRARLEKRPLRPLDALKALRRAISSRWAHVEVVMEEN